MRDLVDDLLAWTGEGRRFAVASVVGVSGSAPREPGAALAVAEDGTAVGSVSGGCVEGAVYELCLRSLEENRPVLQTFGYSDDEAFAVGLTCGGIIEILVWPNTAEPAFRAYLRALAAGEPAALARILPPAGGGPSTPTLEASPALAAFPTLGASPALEASLTSEPFLTLGASLTFEANGGTTGTAGDPVVDRLVAAEAAAMLDTGLTGVREVGCDGLRMFVETYAPPPRLLVFGAVDFAAALTRAGRFLGYHVTVCDARPVFATRKRFPDAHEVVVDWPHRYLERTPVDARTAIAVLTHDPKFDIPLLERALRTDAGYVGAMGSRRTHDERARRLREAGLSEAELSRLRSPIGLDLGARTPEEVAVSIAAELVATRRGGTCRPLTTTSGPVHALTR
ncbi:XdhC family protein [Nonomuraea sp. NPDC059023]|uniref:XdhC family protein n=1 Tax=unclassified Nonomuraea TaxID=2593643 RepID=UPI00369BB82B